MFLEKKEEKEEKEEKSNLIHVLSYGFAQFSDIIAYQTFTIYIFTFYFTIVDLDVILITIGFIIWSIWNSFNDPILGYISDRTHTKFGRRRPYIMLSIVPLAIVLVLLFTPPMSASLTGKFIYFVIIICIFDVFYTMYNLNQTCLFPEIFIDPNLRIKDMNIKQIFGIFALLVAFLLPTFIISDLSDPVSYPLYKIVGLIMGVIVILGALIFLIWGPREKIEFSNDYKKTPSFWNL